MLRQTAHALWHSVDLGKTHLKKTRISRTLIMSRSCIYLLTDIQDKAPSMIILSCGSGKVDSKASSDLQGCCSCDLSAFLCFPKRFPLVAAAEASCTCGDCSSFTADSPSEKQVSDLEPHLVVNEIVQGKHRPREGRQVYGQHHVIGLHCKGTRQLLHTQIRQQVEDVLQRTTVNQTQHSMCGKVCRWPASCHWIALHTVLRLGNRTKMPWMQNNYRCG